MFLIILVISTILKLNQGQIKSTSNLFLTMSGFFLGQSSNIYRSSIKMKTGLYVLLFIWLLFSTILSKCFTSVLLGTFFKIKPTLTVETLEDLVSNPGIKIIGRESLDHFMSTKPKVYEILRKRLFVTNSEKILKILLTPEVMNDMINRKAVLLHDSHQRKAIQSLFPEINYKESEHKYNQQIIYTYVSKDNTNYEKIFQM